MEIIEKKRTGGVVALPSGTDSRGNHIWDYEGPKGNTIPAGLDIYGENLRIEQLEAMGVPYEVIEASGNEGFGSSSGREIPETAFYSTLQEELNWLVYDFDEQIVAPLVKINAALGLLPDEDYMVLPHPLNSSPEEMEYDETEQGPQQGSSHQVPTNQVTATNLPVLNNRMTINRVNRNLKRKTTNE